jgi:Transglutaminase-like superfamily
MIRTTEGYSRRPIGAVKKIRRAIDRGRQDPYVRRFATRILNRAHVEARDDRGEIEALFSAAKTIPFRQDPVGTELIQHMPYQLENWRLGAEGLDCDDFTILLGSLVESVGHPVRIAVTRLPGAEDDGHIYAEAFIRSEGEWVALDATNARADAGWEAPFAEKKTMQLNHRRLGLNLSGPFDRLFERARGAIDSTQAELEKLGVIDPSTPPIKATTGGRMGSGTGKAPPWAFLAIAAGVAFVAMRAR